MSEPRNGRGNDGDPGLPEDPRLRELYASLPAEEPSAEIDRRILEAARRGVVARPRSLVRRLTWTVPLAAAAGVALTLTLTHLTPEQRQENVSMRAAPAMEASATEASEYERGARRSRRADRDERLGMSQDRAADAPVSEEPAGQQPEKKEPSVPEAMADLRRDDSLAKERNRPDAKSSQARKAQPQPSSPMPAPAPPPPSAQPGDAASLESHRSLGYVGGGNAATGEAGAERPQAEADATQPAWPFGLEAGMSGDAACEKVRAVLAVACEARGDAVDLVLETPRKLDAGMLRGRIAKRIILHLGDGKLAGVDLWLQTAGADEKVVLAPPP